MTPAVLERAGTSVHGTDLRRLDEVVRARLPTRLPVGLSREEGRGLIANMVRAAADGDAAVRLGPAAQVLTAAREGRGPSASSHTRETAYGQQRRGTEDDRWFGGR